MTRDRIELLDTNTILALTLWGEARGEPLQGKIAVACVIRNRAAKPGWWGQSPRTVVLSPWQFSCWNSSDPNLPKMLDVADDPLPIERAIVKDVILNAGFPDITGGADGYHTRAVSPPWSRGRTPIAVFHNHLFFRVGLRGDGK